MEIRLLTALRHLLIRLNKLPEREFAAVECAWFARRCSCRIITFAGVVVDAIGTPCRLLPFRAYVGSSVSFLHRFMTLHSAELDRPVATLFLLHQPEI